MSTWKGATSDEAYTVGMVMLLVGVGLGLVGGITIVHLAPHTAVTTSPGPANLMVEKIQSFGGVDVYCDRVRGNLLYQGRDAGSPLAVVPGGCDVTSKLPDGQTTEKVR